MPAFVIWAPKRGFIFKNEAVDELMFTWNFDRAWKFGSPSDTLLTVLDLEEFGLEFSVVKIEEVSPPQQLEANERGESCRCS